MSKDQLLNIAIFTLIFTLIFQIFFTPKQAEEVAPGVALLANSKDVSVPSIPQVRVYNNTDGSYSFGTCDDLGIWMNSQKLVFSGTEYNTFCRSVTIAPHGWYYLPFRSIAPLFTKSGDFLIRVGSSDTAPSLTITQNEPGSLSRFFSEIFFAPIYNFFVALLVYIPGHSLGWAIVIITILIRLILLVPQKQMIESQAKMQKIQPKIQKIQEEFKGDQARIGQELLALYKKEKVNPAGSCLPLLIQMPILIGLYWVISGISDATNHYYLYDALKSFDISAVDSNFFGLNLQSIGGTVGIIFAIVLGILQWIQAKLSFSFNTKATSSTKQPKVIEQKENGEFSPESFMPDPQMMQKMMIYFIPVMIGISAVFLPLGVGLYWFIGTIFVIVQQWVFRRKQKK